MKIATILFVYARSAHTQRVLKALERNIEKPQMLYIFQDGKKESTNITEWKQVNELIKSIKWCKTEVVVSDMNRGLSESIIFGTHYVSECNDAFVVLEDDCVPHPLWLKYMYDSLHRYKQVNDIFCINGCFRKADVESNGTDAYFSRRASSWGWGTWKDRWENFSLDYKVLGRIKKDETKNKQLQVWGKDLESYLLGNVYGTNDSWAVLWALHIIDKMGFCLTPYRSLITNIGNDGSGVHCANAYVELGVRDEGDIGEFSFPDLVELPKNYEKTFRYYWSWTSTETKLRIYNNIFYDYIKMKMKGYSIATYLQKKGIKEIAIWGRGKLCELLIDEVADCIKVRCIIESKPLTQTYYGYSVESINNLDTQNLGIIVIPVYDYEQICELIKTEKKSIWGIDQLIQDILGEK